MTIEEEAKHYGTGAIRIGFSASYSVLSALTGFMENYYRRSESRAVKGLKGDVYKSKDAFYLNAKKEKETNFGTITVSDQKELLKEIKKLCKNRGVDIWIQSRPENMDQIYDNYIAGKELTSREQDYLKAFTIKNDDDSLRLLDDGAIVQFKAGDIEIMDDITKEVEQKFTDIARRKSRAVEKIDEVKEERQKERDRNTEIFKRKLSVKDVEH